VPFTREANGNLSTSDRNQRNQSSLSRRIRGYIPSNMGWAIAFICAKGQSECPHRSRSRVESWTRSDTAGARNGPGGQRGDRPPFGDIRMMESRSQQRAGFSSWATMPRFRDRSKTCLTRGIRRRSYKHIQPAAMPHPSTVGGESEED
jgi:hypothetical protein